MTSKWWKDNEPRTRSQPTLLVSPGDFTNYRRKSSLVERSPIDSTRPLRRSSPRSRLSRARSNSPLLPVSKRKTAKMPVKRSPAKPRTPQGQLIDVEGGGGETEAEIETITSVNADILQRELQTIPQLTFRGEFQSPPTQALGATAGNGNGATAGNGNSANAGNGNGATAGNGNGNGAIGGNGNGKHTGTKPKTMSKAEAEALMRERAAQEEKEKERREEEKREEEVRRNEELREQDALKYKAAMEEKKKRDREADIRWERQERNRLEYEERTRKRHEEEAELERQREEEFQKRLKLKPVSPFIAITQTVPGGILKTPRSTDNLVLRSNVATPSSTGFTTPSRPASAVEPSSFFLAAGSGCHRSASSSCQ